MTRTIAREHEPDPAAIGDRRQFGLALTLVRELAGLTIRDVAKAVGVPAATAGDYFAGRSLPPVKMAGVLPRLLRVCGVGDPVVVERWRLALIRVRRTPAVPSDRRPEPYRGLAAFQPEHAEWLFGREKLTRDLRVRLDEQRMAGLPLVVTGRPGAGKSSVLRAGLLPALAGRGRLMTPGPGPCRRLADELGAALGVPADLMDGIVHRGPGEIASLVPDRDLLPVLVVDQFEQLFTTCDDELVRCAFVDALGALSRCGVGVVVGMRGDSCLTRHGRQLLDPAPPVLVGPMSDAELCRAIESPARRARVDLGSGLVEVLLADIAAASAVADPLPLLSHALLMTWRHRERAGLTVRAYRGAGGITGAVRRSAELAYAALDPRQRELARDLFGRLGRAELCAGGRSPELDPVLAGFVAHGLVTTAGGMIGIAQDAVLTAWPRLAAWLHGRTG